MTSAFDDLGCVSDDELVSRVERLVAADRALTVKLLVHLGELNERQLYLARGFSSMFAYCQEALGMSGSEAYPRIQAAKLCRQLPLVLERLRAGEIHLTAIKMLGPYLTEANHVQVLDRVKGMSKKQIELVIAEIAPKKDAPESLRKLPQPKAASSTAALPLDPQQTSTVTGACSSAEVPAPQGVPAAATFALESPRERGSTTPLSPGRFKLQLTLGQEAHDVLEQLQGLLRHQNPSGDLTSIVVRALTELHDREMKRRFAQTSTAKRAKASSRTGQRSVAVRARKRSSGRSRYIPRAVMREVYARDEGRCTFESSDGKLCEARDFLELHHHGVTFARLGEATAANLRLTCRAHNLFYANQDYGRAFMQRKLREAAQRKSPKLFPDRI